jgi:hypothetical protein
LLANLEQADEIDAAILLVRTRLARASWPLSALTVEARAVGIGQAALNAALLATGAHTVSGRLTLNGYANGHAIEPAPIDEPVAAQCSDDRAAMKSARMWIRRVLADGPRPEADVAHRLAEMGLAHLLQPAAEKLGVKCQGGRWWLPNGTGTGQ